MATDGRRRLSVIMEEFYREGMRDEDLVMEVLARKIGGTTERATEEEDRYMHVDFWWNSPKDGRRIGVDVKGMRRNARSDKEKDGNIHWVELVGVTGHPGWARGKSDYIAFRTPKDILFVRTSRLCEYAERMISGKETVNALPTECYVPYQRKGRKDLVLKVPTSDLAELAGRCGFVVELNSQGN